MGRQHRGGLEAFSEGERQELRLYRKHIEEFAGWGLANQPKMLARIGTSQGSFMEGATKKDMTALLAIYRKVSVAQKDRGRGRAICSQDTRREETDEARIDLNWLKNLKRWCNRDGETRAVRKSLQPAKSPGAGISSESG